MDLAYVPFHGDSSYTDMEFFKRVRARYYVFSGVEPSREVFDALLEGKKTWENKDLGTYYVIINSRLGSELLHQIPDKSYFINSLGVIQIRL